MSKVKKSNYKILLLVPIVLLLLSAVFLINSYLQTGEWFKRSIELKGGALITIHIDKPVQLETLEDMLSPLGDFVLKETRGISGYRILIEAGSDVNVTEIIRTLQEGGLKIKSYSSETIGPALGESFWYQAQLAIVVAFILMGVIVFAIFRTIVPSVAVILAALSDIVVTLAFMQILGISLSLAGIAALLMLIGYSIDTDILLTTRTIRIHEKDVPHRIKDAFTTGITMTGTTMAALISVLIFSTSSVLTQIATVLLIGLGIDLINTWLQNATILRWYCESRGI
ncbi:MAG: protein translocase subunit SecF [Candidatus Aenigmatarchaeota archaeon]|nr:MAG: protein translocase subunit SecF [Candidatus Aenigmarchaeota archaeon]